MFSEAGNNPKIKQTDSPDEILLLNDEQLEDILPRIKMMALLTMASDRA